METIQYSLNNISIDIRLALEYSENQCLKENKNTNNISQPAQFHDNLHTQPSLPIQNHPKDENDIFDEHCLEIYGKKTCILIEIGNKTFQQRFLNKDYKKIITKQQFSTEIPSLIEKSYTVVIVEEIEDEGIREIVAIHSPGI
jgi:hypothetical protein